MRRLLLVAVVVGALRGGARQARGAERDTTVSRVTYYSLSGVMASGAWTFDGAAACGDAFPWLGVVTIHAAIDVTVQCVDTGSLGWNQIDVWSGAGRPWWLQEDWYDVSY